MEKFCKSCGAELEEDEKTCHNCKAAFEEDNLKGKDDDKDESANDKGSIVWCVLGFIMPLVGIILYCEWKKSKPRNAKVAGKGALISIILNIVTYIVVRVVAMIV